MRTDELDFDLPPELIAQEPPPERHASRLLHYRRAGGSVVHRRFSDLPSILSPGDLLVFNNARVLPARFMLRKETGGKVEGLFLREVRPGRWQVLLKGMGSYGSRPLHFAEAPQVRVNATRFGEGGAHEIHVQTDEPAAGLLARVGRMPLPPYIKRDKEHDDRDALDRSRYQTVFAEKPGAVAAPTAALHFSEELLRQLQEAGVRRTFVTLDVGLGTFKPVTAPELKDHVMHVESYSISAEAAETLNRAKAEGRRVVAVGSTAARVLESQPAGEALRATSGETGIFIRPPYEWKHVDAMITNFHLPRSTLIAMVAALTGLEEQRRLYDIAVEQRYRFFSYGDAMIIE